MDFNQRPIWAGTILLFPDQRIYAFQVNNPAARIEVQHKYERLGVWSMSSYLTESTIEINLKGAAVPWDPDGSSGERLALDALGGTDGPYHGAYPLQGG